MKKIYINEESLQAILKNDEEVTFYEFFVSLKAFLKELLTKPHEAEPSELFKQHGINKSELVEKMKKLGIVKSKENITEVPKEEGSSKKVAKHTIQYLIPRKRFNDKVHELHKELFSECKSVFANEDAEIEKIKAMDVDGAYITRGGFKIRENKDVLDFSKETLLVEAVANQMEYDKPRKTIWDFSILLGGNRLNEGIIKSYSPDFISNRLIRCFGLSTNRNWEERGFNGTLRFYKSKKSNGEDIEGFTCLEIQIKNENNEVGRVKHFLSLCGWFLSYEEKMNDKTLLAFEKEHNEDDEAIQDFNVAYHITPLKKVRKILEKGLTPKSGNRIGYHPSRIYLFPEYSYPLEQLKMFGDALHYQTYGETRNEEYAILEVDLSNNDNRIKFYSDPNADGAVFTNDNIPPNIIRVIDTF